MDHKPTLELDIAIIRTSSIGDVVLATACLSLFALLRRNVKVTWIGRPPALPLLKDCYPQMKCLEMKQNYEFSQLLIELKNTHLLIDLQNNLRTQMLRRAFKSLYRRPIFVFRKNFFTRRLTIWLARLLGHKKAISAQASAKTIPQYSQMLNVCKKALFTILPKEEYLLLESGTALPYLPARINSEEQSSWEKELSFGQWLAVGLGALYATKRAPLEMIAEILHRTKEKLTSQGKKEGFALLFLGDYKDRQLAQSLISKLSWDGPVLNLAGKISLWESSLALKKCKILLCNDSALAHISEAVRTPVATIFGPTTESFGFAPYLPNSRSFSAPIGCRPCSRHGKTACRYKERYCFSQINQNEVAEHLFLHLR